VQTADHELVIPQDAEGSYVVIGKVNGERVRFVVDTGATDTVLSPADARRLGVPIERLAYRAESETANGVGYGAPYRAQRLEVGAIALTDFPMTVNRAPMSVSLLGLSFLNRLEAYEFRGRKLILKWREAR
jgi:aspartyl protease family protein